MIKQVWNSRSKKWVKIDCSKKGGIIDMQPEKFTGVPVKGEQQRPVEDEPQQANKNGSFFSRFGV